ncbi:MAG TPA: tRNA uridine-5-carboxymethylaminomethyl(34) synthesis GTPase MnmE, partial [Lacipirellula sp.]
CSSATGAGLEEVAERIRGRIADAGGGLGGVQSTAARCAGSLLNAQAALAAAVDLVDCGGEELIAAEIRAALDALGEVVGAICTDDVLDRVFSQFCIGK